MPESVLFGTLQSAFAPAETAGVGRPLFRGIVEPAWCHFPGSSHYPHQMARKIKQNQSQPSKLRSWIPRPSRHPNEANDHASEYWKRSDLSALDGAGCSFSPPFLQFVAEISVSTP